MLAVKTENFEYFHNFYRKNLVYTGLKKYPKLQLTDFK